MKVINKPCVHTKHHVWPSTTLYGKIVLFIRRFSVGSAGTSDKIILYFISINSCFASGDLCHLLIILENSLDPDQDRHNVVLIGSKLFDTLIDKCFLKTLISKKRQKTTAKPKTSFKFIIYKTKYRACKLIVN